MFQSVFLLLFKNRSFGFQLHISIMHKKISRSKTMNKLPPSSHQISFYSNYFLFRFKILQSDPELTCTQAYQVHYKVQPCQWFILHSFKQIKPVLCHIWNPHLSSRQCSLVEATLPHLAKEGKLGFKTPRYNSSPSQLPVTQMF